MQTFWAKYVYTDNPIMAQSVKARAHSLMQTILGFVESAGN